MTDNTTAWGTAQQVIRIGLYALTGGLVTAGHLTEGHVETIVGAVTGLTSVGWWAYWNWKSKPKR